MTQPVPAPRTVTYEATDEDVANMRKVLPSVVKRIEAEAAAGQPSGALREALERLTERANDPGWHERYRAGMLLVIREVETALAAAQPAKADPLDDPNHEDFDPNPKLAEGLDIPDYGDREPYTFAQAKHLLQKVEKAINKDYHHHDLHAEIVEWLARLLHEGDKR